MMCKIDDIALSPRRTITVLQRLESAESAQSRANCAGRPGTSTRSASTQPASG
jgi:hypothetical protein